MPCKATCYEKIDLWPVAFILGTLGLVRADAKVQAASWNYLRNVWELFTSHHSIPFQSLFMCEQTGNKDFLLGLIIHPLVLYLCRCLQLETCGIRTSLQSLFQHFFPPSSQSYETRCPKNMLNLTVSHSSNCRVKMLIFTAKIS